MRRSNNWSVPAAAAALALVAAGCAPRGEGERPPEPGDRAAAKVDGRVVWTSDVKREAVAQGLIGQGEPLDPASEDFRRTLDEVIDQRLLAAEAARRKLDQDPAAQRRLAAARDRILGDMLVEATVSKAVSEPAIRTLYDEQLKLARRSDEIRARQIVVATDADAQAVRKLVEAGGSFETLAMQRSIDADTRFGGGDLGYFTLDVMPEAYQALKDVKVGALAGPFPVEGGFAVVRVEDRRPEAPIAFEAARPQIVRFLSYDQIRDLIETLRAKAKIETLGPAQSPRAREPADAPKPSPTAVKPNSSPGTSP